MHSLSFLWFGATCCFEYVCFNHWTMEQEGCVSCLGRGWSGGWCSHLGSENDCLLQITASSCWNAAGGDCQAHREGWTSLALIQGRHLNLYPMVQRQKSRNSNCGRVPGRCQDRGQDPGTSDWQLIWSTSVSSACWQVLGGGWGRGGKMEELIRQASAKQKTWFWWLRDGDGDSVDDVMDNDVATMAHSYEALTTGQRCR